MNKQFYKAEKGHLGQYEDWWNFDDNKSLVTHHWDYGTVNGLGSKSVHKTYTAEDSLEGPYHQRAKVTLQSIIDDTSKKDADL